MYLHQRDSQGFNEKLRRLNTCANTEPGYPTPPLFASEPNFITQKLDIMVGDKFIVAENLNEMEKKYCSNFFFCFL